MISYSSLSSDKPTYCFYRGRLTEVMRVADRVRLTIADGNCFEVSPSDYAVEYSNHLMPLSSSREKTTVRKIEGRLFVINNGAVVAEADTPEVASYALESRFFSLGEPIFLGEKICQIIKDKNGYHRLVDISGKICMSGNSLGELQLKASMHSARHSDGTRVMSPSNMKALIATGSGSPSYFKAEVHEDGIHVVFPDISALNGYLSFDK